MEINKQHKEEKSKITKLVPIEFNIAEYPFFFSHRGTRPTTKLIQIDKGKFIDISCAKGLPGAFESDVFMAALCIAHEKGYPEKVHFTLRKFMKLLELNPYHYSEIKKAFERLGTTSFIFKGTFYKDGEYIDIEELLDFKLITSYKFYSKKDSKNPQWQSEKETYFSLHPFIIENIAKKYFRYIDFDQFRALHGIEKRLYLYYTKHLGDQQSFTISLDKLARRIPLETYTVYHLKSRTLQILLKAHETLKQKGIFDYSYDKTNETFTITPFKKILKPAASPTRQISEQTPRKLVEYFISKSHRELAGPITKRQLENAKRLIEELGWEKAKYVVDFACREAPKTGFEMKYFGAVLEYKDEALKELEREHGLELKKQKEEAEKEQELKRLEQEEKEEKELLDYYKTLSQEVQQNLETEAQKLAIERHGRTFGERPLSRKLALLDVIKQHKEKQG